MYKKNGKWAYWKITEEDIQPILDMYQNKGMSAKKIGAKFNSGELTILKVLRDYNVPIRTENKIRKFSRGYTVNENAFADMSEPLAAYLYGWLLTDGYITRNNSIVGIEVGTKDRKILQVLKDYVGTDSMITSRTRTDKRTNGVSAVSAFKFAHEPIINRLCELEFSANKSLKEKVPESLENNKYFWGGVLEGDGHVSSKYTQVFVCGGMELCSKWVDFVKEISPEIRSKIYSSKEPIYYASTTDKKSVKLILDHIYSDAEEGMRLERKYEAYLGRYCGDSY